MIPANTPGPTMVTSISAQMSELIERDDTMMKSASGRARLALGVVLRAAQYATGIATRMPIAVPSVAMLSVSQSGRHSFAMKPQSGGTMRAARSAAWTGASSTNGQMVLSEMSCQHTRKIEAPKSHAAHIASCTAGARRRQTLASATIATTIISSTAAKSRSNTLPA